MTPQWFVYLFTLVIIILPLLCNSDILHYIVRFPSSNTPTPYNVPTRLKVN